MIKRITMLMVMTSVLLLSSCALNHKAQLDALTKFDYGVESVQNLTIAGRDIKSFQSIDGNALSSLPGIALSLLRKDLPLAATVNLQIANPTSTITKINEFKYIIEFGGKQLFEGSVNENINLGQGESMVVPLSFNANIFGVAQEQGFDRVLSDIFTRQSNALFAIKIKPSIKIGNKNIFYPGYITVDKDFGKGIKKVIDKRLQQ